MPVRRCSVACAAALACACATTSEPPATAPPGPGNPDANASTVPLTRPLADVPIAPGDPVAGRFTLSDASAGLAGEGVLWANLHTSHGVIECELFEDRAPVTVANFVGLARGVRPWKRGTDWVKEPFFDGTSFHRVVPGFVIQAGARSDALDGGPGYVIPDEDWQGSKHDRAGLLCMANDGPNTGGSQFFVLLEAAPQLDESFTIFGECLQTDVALSISRVKAYGEKPAEPVALERVEIVRAPRWE